MQNDPIDIKGSIFMELEFHFYVWDYRTAYTKLTGNY